VSGAERIAEAFAAGGKRAALMPYMMGGYPTM
jgi:tryptophan synthase alpha subunit